VTERCKEKEKRLSIGNQPLQREKKKGEGWVWRRGRARVEGVGEIENNNKGKEEKKGYTGREPPKEGPGRKEKSVNRELRYHFYGGRGKEKGERRHRIRP